MRKILLGLTVLCGLIGSVQAHDSTFRFNPEALLFFHDNEFNGEKVNGYTLPGFVLRPKAVWSPDSRLRVEAGVNWLYYWGACSYPAGVTYDGIANHSDSSTNPLHLRPWMRARAQLLPGLSLVLGSLDNTGHGLPQPLYNHELAFIADPEAGAQLLLDSKHASADIWVDWREFIWNNSPTQERLVAGLSAKGTLDVDGWHLYLPLHLVVQHHGGQSMLDTMSLHNIGNGSVGFGLSRHWHQMTLSMEMHAMGYLSKTIYHQPWYAPPVVNPTNTGWGLYSLVRAEWSFGLLTELSLWRSDRFVPLLGSPHYSNVSVNTPGLTLDCMDIVTFKTGYTIDNLNKHYSVSLLGTLYTYLPFTGNRPGYSTMIRGVELSYSVGLYIHLNPIL